MLKRLCLAFAGLFALVSIAQGAGTLPGFSLTPQFDLTGKVAPGCKLYIYQAGSVASPQNAYQDTGLTQVLPNPLTCDAAGRLPQWFVADGNIKVRLTDKNGVQLFVGDNLLVVGPSGGGGGGGGTVDPTTILATGDFKDAYATGVLTGFVRCNGRTLGSATSGATERANADTSALFVFLWGQDPNLTVSGGRGVSAAADFAANKIITLPDCRNRIRAGLGDMGNSDAGRLTISYFGCTGITLGCVGGSESTTLALTQLPTGITSVNASQNISVAAPSGRTVPSADAGITINNINAALTVGSGQSVPYMNATLGGNWRGEATLSASNSIQVTSNNTNGLPHRTVQPTILVTTYIKL
jgi:microcystin-dependent protein